MTHARWLLRTAAIAGMLVLLTGCIKAHQSLALRPDNTASGSLLFAVSREMLDLTGQDPESLLQQMTQGQSPLGPDVDVKTEPYDDGKYIGQTYTFTDVPIEKLNQGEELTFTREGDTFVVDGTADLTQGTAGIDVSDPTTQKMLETFDVQLSVTFPGDVSDTNGALDGRTVTWSPALGEVTDIHAVGSAIEGDTHGNPIAVFILATLLALAVVALVVVMVRRRPGSGAAGTDAEAEGAEPAGPLDAATVPSMPTDGPAIGTGAPEPPVPGPDPADPPA